MKKYYLKFLKGLFLTLMFFGFKSATAQTYSSTGETQFNYYINDFTVKGKNTVDLSNYLTSEILLGWDTGSGPCNDMEDAEGKIPDDIRAHNYSINSVTSSSSKYMVNGSTIYVDEDKITSPTETVTFTVKVNTSWEYLDVDFFEWDDPTQPGPTECRGDHDQIENPGSVETITVSVTFDYSAERAVATTDISYPATYCAPDGGSITLTVKDGAYESSSAYRIYKTSGKTDTPIIFNSQSYTISEGNLADYYNSTDGQYEFFVSEQEAYRMEQPGAAPVEITLNSPTKPVLSLPSAVCTDRGILTLDNYSNVNAVWSGTGVVGGESFDPTKVTAGQSYTLTATTTENGCSTSTTATIKVNPLPDVVLSSIPEVCSNGTLISLNDYANVVATWSGTGVSANKFDPSAAGAGTHTLTASYTNASGCETIETTTVKVNALTKMVLSPLPELCENSAPLGLWDYDDKNAHWSGKGVTSSKFDPSKAGPGTHTLTASVINASGCEYKETTTITVNPLTELVLSNIPDLCENNSMLDLHAFDNINATWSGTGVVGGSEFDPSAAGVGTHTLTASYTNSYDCTDTATITVTVNEVTDLVLSSIPEQCANGSAIDLYQFDNYNAVWSGAGVVGGSEFDPSITGVGTYTLTATYTNGDSCSETETITVKVNAVTELVLSSIPEVCIDGGIIDLHQYDNNNAVWSGTGVVGGSEFDPSTAGAGTHTLTATYTNGDSCADTKTITVKVKPLPILNIEEIARVETSTAAFDLFQYANVTTGTFSGEGVVDGSTFDPSLVAEDGTYTITLTHTDAVTGCSNTTTQIIEVCPTVEVTTPTAPLCYESGILDLAPFASHNVTFTGTGVTANKFDPSSVNPGNSYTINWSYTSAELGCETTGTFDIVVNPRATAPTPEQAGYFRCGPGETTLTAVSPDAASYVWYKKQEDGSFEEIPGLSGSTETVEFEVGKTIVGIQSVNAEGCISGTISEITVNVNPQPEFTVTGTTVCRDVKSIDLTSLVDVPGGTFSGEGVSGTKIYPEIIDETVNGVEYTYTIIDPNTGCTNSKTATVHFYDVPTVAVAPISEVCLNSGALDLLQFETDYSGGTWSGIGVSGSSFDPTVAGVGIHEITYTYTTENGCQVEVDEEVTVNAVPYLPTATSSSFEICGPGETILTVSSPDAASYQWYLKNADGSYTLLEGETSASLTTTIDATTVFGVEAVNTSGCTTSAKTEVEAVVNPLPEFTFNGTSLCENGEALDLKTLVDVQGGTFSGPGVSGTTFNPSLVDAPTATLIYTVTSSEGCSVTKEATIELYQLPDLTIADLGEVCLNTGLVDLSQFETEFTGGTWSGNGVTGTSFDASVAGVGAHTLTYTYTDGQSCTTSVSGKVIVNALPAQPVVTDNSFEICSAGDITLSVSSPDAASYQWYLKNADGSYTRLEGETSASLSTTISETAVFGVEAIGDKGCATSAKTDVEAVVNPLPEFTFNGTSLCENGEALDLKTLVDVQGGVFEGTGVSGTSFNPSLVSGESVVISYTVTSEEGCSVTEEATITLSQLPDLTIADLGEVCLNTGLVDLSQFETEFIGGTWSGNSVEGNIFDPSEAGVGRHTLTYTYTDGKSCTTAVTGEIKVNSLPDQPTAIGTFERCGPGEITVRVSSSDVTMYQWYLKNADGSYTRLEGETSASLTTNIDATTLFAVAAVNSSGCETTGKTEVEAVVNPLPEFTFNGTSICENGEAIDLRTLVDVQGGTFAGIGVSENMFNPSIVSGESVVISYTVTSTEGCPVTKEATITLSQLPPLAVADLGEVCISTERIDLRQFETDYTGGTWSGKNVEGRFFYPGNAGAGNHTISYEYTTTEGCATSIDTDIYVYDLTEKPIVDDVVSCQGSSVNVQLTNYNSGHNYKWFDDQGNEVGQGSAALITVDGSKTYSVIGYNEIGCQSSTGTFKVSSETPEGGITIPQNVIAGAVVQFFTDIEADTYFWEFGNGKTSKAQNPFVTFNSETATHDVTLTVTYNGCQNVITGEVDVVDQNLIFTETEDENEDVVTSDEIGYDESNMKVLAYPNPVNTPVLNLEIPSTIERKATIKVYSLLNQVLHEERLTLVKGNNKVGIDAANLPSGYLMVMIIKEDVGAIPSTTHIVKVLKK